MSTRCQLAVYEKESDAVSSAEVLIYRHGDGYPGSADGKEYGVLADIVPFLQAFEESRGISDTSYCSARLTQHLGNIFKDSFLSLGLDGKNGFHGDIEYFYHVSPTAVKVYECTGENPDGWEVIKRVDLKK